MLALKSVLARVDRVPTLVLDEIDADIGGRVAHRVAEQLARVATHHQVFCITHLRADRGARGSPPAGAASAILTDLRDDDRVRELARLLGGDPESATSIEHAREVLAAR